MCVPLCEGVALSCFKLYHFLSEKELHLFLIELEMDIN